MRSCKGKIKSKTDPDAPRQLYRVGLSCLPTPLGLVPQGRQTIKLDSCQPAPLVNRTETVCAPTCPLVRNDTAPLALRAASGDGRCTRCNGIRAASSRTPLPM